MRRRALLVTSLVVVAAGAWSLRQWFERHNTLPPVTPFELEFDDRVPLASLPVLPDRAPEPTRAEQLEQRLAALAAAIERRRGTDVVPGLVEFDVEKLSADINAVLTNVGDDAQVSIHIRDLRTGHVLFDDYGDTPLIPASNQKLLTSAAALELLGPDYTFVTSVVRDADAVYLVGHGDPTLQVADLESIATAVAPAIDASVQRLVFDDSAFSHDRLAPGYNAGGPGLAYEPETSALSVGYNYVEVTAAPLARERKVGVTTQPAAPTIVIDNRARLARKRALSVISRERDGDTVIEVRGTLPSRGPKQVERRRVYDPGRVAASLFAGFLAEQQASMPLPITRGVAPADAEVLFEHESPPLMEILDLGLAYSNNFIAEQVLRTLAWRMTGEPGDWAAGDEILQGYWSALGRDPEEIVVENGSGLSRAGRLTSAGLVDLITVASHGAQSGRALIDALPVAGEPGTMRTRLRLSGKRVRAKTGTLDDVSGLSGVITAEDGTPVIAFSILINARLGANFGASLRNEVEDRIVTATLFALDDYEARVAGLASSQSGG
ncbi:MAG: D-alanyl-D-alanine carboxypeptidase/D-alanyl-D-alanine-endopeptidase [Deltaproteobacteria bacterium]|nr:D-alanyl-D-alanine carboxypeptidase/D-alanyl-D-alanine-endopeptidase [Deltaproteobacteria bacterium]MBK8236731.1 D-alanyl-D-alanine carboxypeptidase/D-alanyl-D-alanine-endopeptidase [Deltaproteobacteria bacterium]MBK8720024.1 D-alanyl-D-alanine carboxypeptidase/D-alanyl-D-alanine-endopeptidase [Deltaproteobacteria bacterium]